MKDVWEDAPKEAEFFSRRLQNYYKIVDGVLFWVKEGPGRHVGGGVERSRYHVGHRILGVLEPRPAEPDEWIEHHGSNNPPVHPDTVIIAQLRVAKNDIREKLMSCLAGQVRWNHTNGMADIIAYKVVKKP